MSVEVAIKLVLQSWHGERRQLLTWRGGYHGDTFGAMAVCDPDGGMHSMWKGSLAEHVFAPLPALDAGVGSRRCGRCSTRTSFAGVIVEPIVQGAGGMRFHPRECVQLLRDLCDEHGVPLILDEIATGFGRTGDAVRRRRAGRRAVPRQGAHRRLHDARGDALPRGASRERIDGPLMHGPTFMANPLAVVRRARLHRACSRTAPGRPTWRGSRRGLHALHDARDLPGVKDVRVKGAIGVIQLDHPIDGVAATRAAVERGVWLRPFRDLVYTMPPYVTDDEDIARICAAAIAGAAAG